MADRSVQHMPQCTHVFAEMPVPGHGKPEWVCIRCGAVRQVMASDDARPVNVSLTRDEADNIALAADMGVDGFADTWRAEAAFSAIDKINTAKDRME